MDKERKKIPILNERIDPYILLYIVKRSLIISGLYFILAIIAAFLYNRYTPPKYRASSVIQVKDDSKSNLIYEIIPQKEEVNLNQTIELLRSPEFLKRTINKLPLYIGYFAQGTFLEFEMYRMTPFEVKYELQNQAFYNIPLYLTFTNHHAIINYKLNDEPIEKEVPLEEWVDLGGLKIQIKIKDHEAILEQTQKIKKNSYYFIVYDTLTVLQKYSSQLDISVLNGEAKTIQISMIDKNAQKSAEFVKTMAEEFINFDLERKIESSKYALAFIDQQSKILYKTIDSLEEQLLQYRYQLPYLFFDDNKTSYQSSRYDDFIKALTKEAEEIDIKLLNLEKFIHTIEANSNLTVYEIISLIPETEPIVLSIINKLQSLEEQKEQLLTSKTANSFQIKSLENQLSNHRKTLISMLKTNIQRLQDKKKLYLEKIKEYQSKEFSNNPVSDLDFLKIKRMYDINVSYFNKLLEKKAEFLISQAGSVSQYIILQNAPIPTKPVTASKRTVLIAFITIAILLSLTTIVLRYVFYSEITSVDDITQYTDAKVLGIIPLYKSKLQLSQLLIDIKPNSIFTESFRACRASIEFMQTNKTHNIIAISSTVSGEGKTFFAINFAGILSLQNKRVLLIDLDLRRPRIHMSFNTDNSIGISTILAGKISINDCIKKSKLPTMDFITAGPIPPNPSELINSSTFKSLISELSSKYDYVIIDTPPLGLVSDALTVFKEAHFPIYVIKSHFSKRSFLYHINHLIDEKGITNLLVIINGFDYEKSKYGYQYSYSYNYGYGYTTDTATHYYEDVPVKKKNLIARILKKI